MAKKILLNSAYGALGNKYFRYFNVLQAESITTSGQLSIRWIENKLNEWFWENFPENNEIDYVIAADTDSVYISFDYIVEKYLTGRNDENIINFLDIMSKDKIEPYIGRCYEELSEYMNCYSQKMFMSREVIADKGVWTAKKRYILNVYDNEGVRYLKPKLKVMGIEAVRSSTPSVCREKINSIMEDILNTDEDTVIGSIQSFKNEFHDLTPEEISFPRSCNNINNYHDVTSIYSKGTPVHVKGALLYNYYLQDSELNTRYQLIKEGDKIKWVYLKVPNPFKDKVVSFVNSLPKEFELNKYIDYELQFEKSFLDPIKSVLDAIGWKHEKTSDLTSFF
jgi:DNA polymerase elongation subunit (family B)